MSAKLMGEVFSITDMTTAEKVVLLALADHADPMGGRVFPSTNLIAWKTDYSRRQVQNILKRLRNREILIQVRKATWHYPTVYRIDLSSQQRKKPFRDEVAASPQIEIGVQNGVLRDETQSATGAISDVRGELATSPKSSTDPPIQTSNNPLIAEFDRAPVEIDYRSTALIPQSTRDTDKARQQALSKIRTKMAKEKLLDIDTECKFILSFTEVDDLQKLYNERRLRKEAREATQDALSSVEGETCKVPDESDL